MTPRRVPADARSCNVTPGGHILFGPLRDNELTISVKNWYSGERPNLVNHVNMLQLGRWLEDGVDHEVFAEVPVTRRQLHEAAEALLAIANRDSNWTSPAEASARSTI